MSKSYFYNVWGIRERHRDDRGRFIKEAPFELCYGCHNWDIKTGCDKENKCIEIYNKHMFGDK